MKHLLTFSLALASTAALAQTPITITAAQYPATAATIERFQGLALGNLATPSLGANQTWDYRAAATTGAPSADGYNGPGTPPPFAGSVRSYDYTINGAALTQYEGFEAQGFGQLGSTALAQTLPLGGSDFVAVPAQTLTIPNLRVPLPMTSATRVSRTSRTLLRSSWTVAAAGLNQAPMVQVQRIATRDSVVAWGTVRIAVAGNAAGSAPIPVLLERRQFIRQDSFYLGGQPAPAALLAAFGLTQGGVYREYRQYFYRQNAAQPVMVFGYTNNTYSTLLVAYRSAETTIPLGTPAAREVASGGLLAWPNPAQPGQPLRFSLGTTAPGQPLRLTLRDATGRTVAALPAANGQPLPLPALPAGLYLAEAEAADGSRASRRIMLE